MKPITKLHQALKLLETELNKGTPEDKPYMLPARQLLLLTYVYQNEGDTQRELVKSLNSKESATSKHIKLLKDYRTTNIPDGLLYTKPDPTDYKANKIYMTDAGKTIMAKIEKWLEEN